MTEIAMIKIFWGDSEYNIIRNAGRGEYTIVGKAREDISSLITTIESQKEEIEQYQNIFDHAEKAIYTQHCTMNHMENTEHEKGQISGLIQASKILTNSISKYRKEKSK